MAQKIFKIILILTISVVFFIRLFYSLPNAPLLDCDAISSVQAARSIIETGIPMRNGILYQRDYLAHYLLAGSMVLFGDNYLGYAAPNLVFSILVLILLYFVAKILTNNKIVIFLTILFVAISSVENTFAINPRSYMQFQFFFLLTVFCFYKGFVKKKESYNEISIMQNKRKKYQILTLFSYFASVLSHLSGLILMPILGLYLIIKNRKWYKDKLIPLFLLVIFLFSVFLISVKFPGVPIKSDSARFNLPYDLQFVIPFIREGTTGLSFRHHGGITGVSTDLTSYFPIFFDYLPFICLFIFIGTAEAIKHRNYKLLYFHYIFWISFFMVTLFTLYQTHRYIFFIFPLSVLLAFLGIARFIKFVVKKKNLTSKYFKYFGCGAILILSIFFTLLVENFIAHFPIYTFRSTFPDYREGISYLSESKKENDIIITDDRVLYLFYLNHCDYYLRQSVIEKNANGKKWSALRPEDRVFITIDTIDSIDKLKKVLNDNQRVWLAGSKNVVSPEMIQYIKDNMELKFVDYPVCIYFSGE